MTLSDAAGTNPSESGAVGMIEKLVREARSGKKIHICDFRKSLHCDAQTRTCKDNLMCGTLICAPNYICRETGEKKACLPDCSSPTLDGSEECTESFVKKLAIGHHISDEEEIEHEARPEASHDSGFKIRMGSGRDDEDNSGTTGEPCSGAGCPTEETSTDGPVVPPVVDGSSKDPPTEGTEGPGPGPDPTGGPPIEKGNGFDAPCTLSNDCDPETFLTCYDNKCACMRDLIYNKFKKTCQIPYRKSFLHAEDLSTKKISFKIDKPFWLITLPLFSLSTDEIWGDTFLAEPKVETGHGTGKLPSCYRGECSLINDHYFCHSLNQNGGMVLTESKFDKFTQRSAQGGGESLMGMSKFGMFASCIMSFAMWSHIMYDYP